MAGIDAVADVPMSMVTILGCVLYFLWIYNNGTDYPDVGFNYRLVVEEGQLWRIITSSYAHISIMHLFFNMYSLFNVSSLEQAIGSFAYVKYSFILVIFSELLIALASHVLIVYLRREQQRNVFSLGYSCVVFGMFSIATRYMKGSASFFGIPMPPIAMPFAALIFTSLIVPRASFMGHLAGIVVGFGIAYGAFEWFSDYFFICILFWVFVAVLVSAKRTTYFPLPILELANPEAERIRSIVDGQLVWSPVEQLEDFDQLEEDADERKEQERGGAANGNGHGRGLVAPGRARSGGLNAV